MTPPFPISLPNPAVSVVIPVYNGAHLISASLESVFNQTFQDFEVLVVDDGSTDGTRELLQTFEPQVRVFHQPNGGASSARNHAIRQARGEFIAFLDGDDLWEPRKLELQVETLRAHPESGLCSTECVCFDEKREWPLHLLANVPDAGMVFDLLLVDHCVTTSAVMVRRACLDDVGCFDESLRGAEDYNLFLRLAKKYPFRFLRETLVKSRIHAGNLSANLAQMCRDEIVNLDKIDALYPELRLPRRKLQAGIWFRFGQYHFDNHDFSNARVAFAESIRRAPLRAPSYIYFFASLLPGTPRERARDVVRIARARVGKAVSEQGGLPQQKGGVAASPKTVVMVTWSLVAGGSETYALTLAKNLDKARFEPILCALDQGGALEAEIRHFKIPYRVMHRRGGLQFRLMVRMFRLFRQTRARVVHTHHFNQLFYSLLGAKLVGARVIHTEHSVEAFKRPRLRLALRILSRFCHRVVVIGEDGARVLCEDVGIPDAKLEIIRAGVDLAAFNESKTEARREFGLKASAPVAAIVARLSSEKNHHNLLEAWAKVIQKVPGATLLVAGAGPEEAALRAQIERLELKDSVQLLGVRRDVARVLAACNLFVLASDREGLPVSVLEAMAAARAVVATDVGDLGRVVQPEKTGLLVPPRDAEALAAALTALLSDLKRAAELGKAGKSAVAGFGLAPMVEAHQKLYDAEDS